MPRSLRAQIEKLEEDKAGVARRLRELKAREREAQRKNDHRRNVLAGQTVIDHARNDERFRVFLARLLDRAVTQPNERKLFDDIFDGVAEWNREIPANGNASEGS